MQRPPPSKNNPRATRGRRVYYIGAFIFTYAAYTIFWGSLNNSLEQSLQAPAAQGLKPSSDCTGRCIWKCIVQLHACMIVVPWYMTSDVTMPSPCFCAAVPVLTHPLTTGVQHVWAFWCDGHCALRVPFARRQKDNPKLQAERATQGS